MSETEYDVVIVGGGITGAMVAKTLSESGSSNIRRVLILEAGTSVGQSAEGYRDFVQRFYTQMAKVPNSPYPDNPDVPTASVLDLKQIPPQITDGYLVQNGPLPFLSDYAKTLGGTTLHWLGTCLRMLPNDFKLKSQYGQAVDWPITYQELRPYYERAEKEIGVSANVEEQIFPGMGDDYFGAGYQFPMHKIPESYLDQRLAEGVKGLEVAVDGQDDPVKVVVRSTPVGRNSTPNPAYDGGKGFKPVGMVGDPETGQRCEGNSSCVPICPVQAKYNALKTLNAIKKTNVTVEIRAQSVASQVTTDPANGRVTGLRYKSYKGENSPEFEEKTVTAKIYVLAAHAIENAKLLLASDIANSSDQLGRNLMDHPVMLTWGLMPQSIGAFRGPGSTSGIPAFRDGKFRATQASFRVEIGNWGWNWPTGSPNSDVTNAVDQGNLFGTRLRSHLTEKLPRQFRIGWEAEQLPEATNRVTIDSAYKDKLGNFRPVISYDIPNYTKSGLAQAKRVSDQVFARAGVEEFTTVNPTSPGYFTYEDEGYSVNGAGHVVGTHRMGFSRSDSVVDRNQRCWDHDNLYLVGCGNMSTLGTSNPTLTAAALSIWAAENIVKELR